MNLWMWPLSLVGILSAEVVCGTDMFFLTIGRPAPRLASCKQHQSRVRSGMVRQIRRNQFPLAKLFVCNRRSWGEPLRETVLHDTRAIF